MSVQQPELDVANALAAALNLTVGTEIKYGLRRPSEDPGNASVKIWVEPSGGQAPAPFLNASVEGSFWYPKVMVLVWSDPDDWNGGATLARQVRDALHLATVNSVAGKPYVRCFSTQSEPNYDGPIPEANGTHQFSNYFELLWKG